MKKTHIKDNRMRWMTANDYQRPRKRALINIFSLIIFFGGAGMLLTIIIFLILKTN